MTSNDRKALAAARQRRLAARTRQGPKFWERYRLGAAMAKHLDPLCTLDELGQALGVTRQNAYTEACLALGTLAWKLRERFGSAEQGPL